jgi:prenyltransferase beta subunit
VAGGVEYLLAAQADDGGFSYLSGDPIDSNSTALSIQALIAAGADDAAIGAAMTALMAFQNENGSFSWMLDPRDENLFSTVEAIPALAGLAMSFSVTDAGGTPVAATPIAGLLAA